MEIKHVFQFVTMSSILVFSSNAFAVTADDVVCAGCINGADISSNAVSTTKIKFAAITTDKIKGGAVTKAKIAGSAVTSGKIAAGAVTSDKIADDSVTTVKIVNSSITTSKIVGSAITSGKIANGAVSEAKLSSAVQTKLNATGGGVTTYDMPTITATQQVYALYGDFTSSSSSAPAACQSPGSDSEVRDISRSDVQGGTKTVIVRKRYSGSTLCHHQKIFIYTKNGTQALYKRQIYNLSGVLQKTDDFSQDFDFVDCPDCALVTRRDDMGLNLTYLSGEWSIRTDNVDGNTIINQGIAGNTTSLQGANESATLNEDSPSSEVVTGCNGYLEQRTSNNMGEFWAFREVCADVGKVWESRRSSDGTSQLFELIDYTL